MTGYGVWIWVNYNVEDWVLFNNPAVKNRLLVGYEIGVSSQWKTSILGIGLWLDTTDLVLMNYSLALHCSSQLSTTVLWTKAQGLSNRTTLVLSNTRELDRVPNTK